MAIPLAPNVDNPATTNQMILSGSWEIDLWGKLRRATEAARASLLATEENRRAVVLSLVAAVANGYVNLRDLDKQLEVAVATAQSRKESYEVFKLRFEGGLVSDIELNQSKAVYEQALATIPLLQKNITVQENDLNLLLGRNPGPIPRGKTIDATESSGRSGWPALGPADQSAGHPPGRTGSHRGQCQHRGGQGPLFSDHILDRAVWIRQQGPLGPLYRTGQHLELGRSHYRPDFYRRRHCRTGESDGGHSTTGPFLPTRRRFRPPFGRSKTL